MHNIRADCIEDLAKMVLTTVLAQPIFLMRKDNGGETEI